MFGLMILWTSFSASGAAIPIVEVLYLNHGPMQPVVKQLKDTFSKYDGKIKVSWYDLDTSDGQKFMASLDIREHVPLIIRINGSDTVKLPQGNVRLAGFPVGSGPEPFQGKWTMKNLEAVLDQATARK